MPAPQSALVSGLTTTQLSARTGVPSATLRMWETRHGFPVPARLPGGHRRYSEHDVEMVRAVIRRRGEGLSLGASIDRARAGDAAMPASIFAGLAQRRPDLPSMMLPKHALLALSRAIEDELMSGARTGVLVGSFQAGRFYRQSERRWRELARTARIAVVLADFKRPRQPRTGAVEIPIRGDHPLAREWAIVAHAPDMSACLAGWEIPSPSVPDDRDRRFEVLWSPEPEVALDALSVAAGLMTPLAPAVAQRLTATLEEPIAPAPPELRAAVRQAHRMLAYLATE